MPGPLPKPKRQKPNAVEGTALVIVLSCLVLLAALAISLLNRVESDRSSSAAYRGGTLTRTLAEYAINVVMAQITAATKADPSLAWASQPGAIRTYSATGSGLVNIYKLYSSTNMVANSTAIVTDDATALANWAANAALYTDLNAPVVSGSCTNYPILDPRATNSVQGFAISGAPTTATQPAPMPVTWLYVLQDGTLVAPAGGSGNTVTVTGASPANPITGRIAFWADDDTCKVNVNTASGMPWSWTTNNPNTGPAPTLFVGTAGATNTTLYGNFWDTPILGNYQDDNLTYSQPWRSEYQRYPGHPATVSLSAVFTNLSTNDIMAISPRINYQNNLGSMWGTVTSTNGINTNTIPSDGARLYANVDELLYATNRSSTNSPDNPLTTTQIEQGRFFLTASSRAPDVTLFNTPRLLCWPINTSTNMQTPYDNLIAFCGTLPTGSANTYFFQRSDAYSPTVDYNANSRLLGYLRRMTTTAVPGFGGPGILNKSTYTADTEQITTEIFDYIRCINLQDTSVTNNPAKFYSTNALVVPSTGTSGTRGFGRIPTITKAGMLFWYDTNSVSGGVTNTLLCARLVMETFVPGHGYPHITNTVGYSNVVSGLTGGFQWGTNTNSMQNIFASNNASYTLANPKAFLCQVLGGRISVTASLDGASNTGSPLFPTNSPTNALYFKGGDLSVTTYYNGNVIQVINNLKFPDLTNSPLPLPTVNTSTNANFNGPAAWAVGRRVNAAWNVTLFTNDVVRSVQLASGDFRMTAAQASVNGATSYTNHPTYFDTSLTNGCKAHAFTFNSGFYEGAGMITNAYYNTAATTLTNVPQGISGNGGPGAISGVGGEMITNSTNGGASFLMRYGDFDNGYGVWPDGPYIGFADEGMSSTWVGNSGVPYYTTGANVGFSSVVVTGPGYFSPNRLVPSAGIMGSLSTGVMANSPWQTLLFRPAALTSANHPGLANPPDYLLLDLFNMPVVEPYAISEPLSTAGRVNMNYQILPFTWIKRSTAVQAALHTELITAIPNGLGASRKNWNSVTTTKSRFPLDLSTNAGTLRGFEDRFATNDIFRSAAEICSIPLVPYGAGATYANMASWWTNYAYTGENSKERPYARIYPKLTTKSNTYTVHYRVEVLKKSPGSVATTWTEGTDKVISTYRGSTTIERYVNPGDPSIIDYASQSLPLGAASALPYKFRILADRQFNP